MIASCCLTWLIVLAANFVHDWNSWVPATTLNTFNEAVRDGFLRQPWNTISSVPIFFVGVYLLCLPIKHGSEKTLNIVYNPVMRFLIAFSFMVSGVGSVALHMSLTFVGQVADVSGMYLLSVFLIEYAIICHKNKSVSYFIVIYVVASIILIIFLILLPDLRLYLFALLIAIGLFIEYRQNARYGSLSPKYLFASASWLVFGFMFWTIDTTKLFFNPYSSLQGHALWHLCAAVACALLYTYYTSEKSLQSAPK